jgi:hypothetical protein
MVEEMTIKNDANLTAKVSEKEFSNISAKMTTLYLIDYEMVGNDAIVEFTFGF